jgi:hypothetical protein
MPGSRWPITFQDIEFNSQVAYRNKHKGGFATNDREGFGYFLMKLPKIRSKSSLSPHFEVMIAAIRG